ncbi:hypothetical protein BDF20DRAFT_434582 [Mycotypha africana]|uniref:uncharacterized protein n=1 Tax=Mycotypha africana TaxID=64632 RepID=UPI0023006225|nr:uncharacterized protein BDF20DRAFT_434582 [Mycotypha africana]KAI8981887.1 hypothetical protein BDF20DRAFT_434582 [Mycotypha africana]
MRAIFILMIALCVLFQVGVLAGKHPKKDDDTSDPSGDDNEHFSDDSQHADTNHDHNKHDNNDDDAVICSNTIKACVSDIVVLTEKLKAVRGDVNGFKAEDGFLAAYALHSKIKEIEDAIYKSRYDCCAIPRKLDNAETEVLLDLEQPLLIEVKLILNTLLLKKPELQQVLMAGSILRNDLRNIQALFNPLGVCLIEKVSDDKKAIEKKTIAALDSLFSAAINAC